MSCFVAGTHKPLAGTANISKEKQSSFYQSDNKNHNSLTCISGHQEKEKDFIAAVNAILNYLNRIDSSGLEKYIDKKTGIYIIGREGVFDRIYMDTNLYVYYHGTTLINYYKGLQFGKIQYSALPRYDCSSEKWSKQGTFVDTTNTDTMLSFTAKTLNKYGIGYLTAEDISVMQKIESVSRRIVVANNKKQSFVFYLSFIGKLWRLTIIDLVTDDCSA